MTGLYQEQNYVLSYLFIFILCVSVLSACIYVHHMLACCQRRPEGGLGSPKIGVVRQF